MRFNFKLAEDMGGITYLWYDDSNPEKGSKDFIQKMD